MIIRPGVHDGVHGCFCHGLCDHGVMKADLRISVKELTTGDGGVQRSLGFTIYETVRPILILGVPLRKSTMSALGISHKEKRMSKRPLSASWTPKQSNPESCPKPNRAIRIKQRINEGWRCFVARNRLICNDRNSADRQPANPTQKE